MRGSFLVVPLSLLALVAVAGVPAAGPLDDPAPGTPAWYARSVADYVHSQGRGLDQETNPDYQVRFLPLFRDFVTGNDPGDARVNTDPYRLDWGTSRGTAMAISYLNRYGARISGHLWVPALPFIDLVSGQSSDGPFPALVMVNSYAAIENIYWGIAQSLAEAGYLVMTFDPQGQGLSDVDPDPTSVYCDPDGSWRDPQEMGIREQGPCAGVDPPEASPGGSPLDLFLTFADLTVNGEDYQGLEALYGLSRPRFVFGALDAVAWLLSNENPAREFVDDTRVAIAGHSLGADGALHAGNGDPLGRFVAVATFDGYGGLLDTVPPAVPTMLHHAETQELGPYRAPPRPSDLNAHGGIADEFIAAEVDTSVIVLRGSTHQEWSYLPHPIVNPFCTPFCNASSLGERVALYYAQAWFDLHLKGLVTAFVRGDEAAQAADARTRLLADAFDDSVDASSIGQGTWDPLTQMNAPYTIAGEAARDHLSFLYPSRHMFDGISCPDIRDGC